MEKRLQIYRITQEALTNIEKHAEAKEAIVTMRQSNEVCHAAKKCKSFNEKLTIKLKFTDIYMVRA